MKTYILDIETAPSLAYVWGVWKQDIGESMLLNHTYIMSCSIKELGKPDVTYYENRTEDDKDIVTKIARHLVDADFVIAHNGRKFDIPLIKARAVVNGLAPMPPFKVIDTLDLAKKEFRFVRNTLSNLAKQLNVEHEKLTDRKFNGFALWYECLRQNEEAWQEMKEYNILDVIVIEEVYLKLRAWSSNHPTMTTTTTTDTKKCPTCGSEDIIRSGYYNTNKGRYQRYRCHSCGTWSSESTMMKKHTKEIRQNILVNR